MERDLNLHLEHKKTKTLTRRRWPFLESASECLDLIMRVFVYQSTFEAFFHQTQSVVHYKLGCRMFVLHVRKSSLSKAISSHTTTACTYLSLYIKPQR